MLNEIRRGAVLGGLLVVAGILFLLSNLGVFDASGWLIGGLFCLGGLFFLSMLREGRSYWWSIIPGVVLFDLGSLIVLSSLFPGLMNRIGGAFFLGGISLAFWLIYVRIREYWWAIIPGGVLATLAAVTVVDLLPFGGMIVPATFFLGMAATFALVSLLAGRDNNQFKWAWYPTVVLGIMGCIFLFFAGNVGSIIMPAALIVLGLYMVGKTLIKREN
jgi:hypothetical protein